MAPKKPTTGATPGGFRHRLRRMIPWGQASLSWAKHQAQRVPGGKAVAARWQRLSTPQKQAAIGAGGLLFAGLVFLLLWSRPLGEDALEQAVVSIEVTSQHGDWATPWNHQARERATGSGFVIAPGEVLTNAHVVSDAKQIILRQGGKDTAYFAKVAFIAHDCDLALLRVDDPAFARVTPLKLGGLPTLQTNVRTYGYPAGGEKLSRTEGVVSRIEFNRYIHSGADLHLSIQTDSAINPGNSGGPVLQGGKVVGVAFQTNTQLSSVGFFIPVPVIRRFLDDIQDGTYHGFGEMGVVTSNLENPAYRQWLGLPSGRSGVVVDRVLPGSAAEKFVQPGDVVMAIEGDPVANDGTIAYHGHRVNFSQRAEEMQAGERVTLTLWRKKREETVLFPLSPYADSERMRNQFDHEPYYLIYAGLVFMPLDKEYLATYGNYWEQAGKNLLYHHFYKRVEKPDLPAQALVLTRVLPHPVNSAYRGMSGSIVEEINGRKVNTLQEALAALENGRGAYTRIRLAHSHALIFIDRDDAAQAHREILANYGIPSDRRLP
ncbi:MAG: serine protease [Deltaproteobacteria bacterium]|nr:serine protease [Deltaproteobacteria bacterium]